MIPFDDLIMGHLTTALPTFVVATDVSNDLPIPDRMLLVGIVAGEFVTNDGWDSEESPLWEVTIDLQLIVKPSEATSAINAVHKAVKALQYQRIVDPENPDQNVATILRVATSSVFSNVGQAAVVGGKPMIQKTGQYTTFFKEVPNGSSSER